MLKRLPVISSWRTGRKDSLHRLINNLETRLSSLFKSYGNSKIHENILTSDHMLCGIIETWVGQ